MIFHRHPRSGSTNRRRQWWKRYFEDKAPTYKRSFSYYSYKERSKGWELWPVSYIILRSAANQKQQYKNQKYQKVNKKRIFLGEEQKQGQWFQSWIRLPEQISWNQLMSCYCFCGYSCCHFNFIHLFYLF